jgi:hypothetical protein
MCRTLYQIPKIPLQKQGGLPYFGSAHYSFSSFLAAMGGSRVARAIEQTICWIKPKKKS